jgi:hypothetical protein
MWNVWPQRIISRPYILLYIILSGGLLQAQENHPSPDSLIQAYFSRTGSYASIYTGKTSTPYDKRFENHPYFVTDKFTQGTLSYNHVIYKDILMRLDLYRNELDIYFPGTIYQIALEKEKVDYALLHDATIVTSIGANYSKNEYLVLLYDGMYPVIKKYTLKVREEINSYNEGLERSFNLNIQYDIYIDDTSYPIKNKKTVLKLFPDRRKELNDFARQNKLNFKKQAEQSMIALVKHYEYLQRIVP